MRKMYTTLIAAAVAGVQCAATAQTIFFDGFDGNALKPHWEIWPFPAAMEHEVRDGLLIVRKLTWPSEPGTPFNEAAILAELPVQLGDFELRARMGWEEFALDGQTVVIDDSMGQEIAAMTRGRGIISVRTRMIRTQVFPAPPPGMHEFKIRRVGANVDFFLNDVHLLTAPDFGNPTGGVGFIFAHEWPDPGRRPVYVDMIRVVPVPGTAVVAVAVAPILFARRRRSCQANGNQ